MPPILIHSATSRRSLLLLCLASAAAACGRQTSTSSASTTVADTAFRNAVNEPPKGWTGSVFELNHAYPKSAPSGDLQATAPWLSREVDFSTQVPVWEDGWDDYMADLLAYIRDGQDQDLSDTAGWSIDVGGVTRWYHVPWMAYDEHSGREFVHGLTNERTAHIKDLIGDPALASKTALTAVATEEGESYETWAFGVYNQYGGYSIGQVVPEDGVPRANPGSPAPTPIGLPFAEGTLVTKLLFSTASAPAVPFLKGSPQWTANRHVNPGKRNDLTRKPGPVQLVQIDVAVTDSRAPTGWVYGTFVYNGTLTGQSPWDRLSPVGLQWGSDPQTFPAVPELQSQPIQQSVLAPIDIFEHDGAQGRLAGPVDNSMSSCMSCHGGSFAAAPVGTPSVMGQNVPPVFGFTGMGTTYNQENVYYFNNIKYPEPYADPKYFGAIPLDTSLQLAVAFTQYAKYLAATK